MKHKFHNHRTWIFDCDGVLLDSNPAKANAFYTAALPYGKDVAEKIREYHQNNGGISRFAKFRYVFEKLLGKSDYEHEYQQMVHHFSAASRAELLRCQPVLGVREFLQSAQSGTRMFVISGAEQEELRWCLAEHQLAHHFRGIFGSPRSKPEVLKSLTDTGELLSPAVYFGDSRYDHESATAAGCDFVFVSGYTDFSNWKHFTQENNIRTIKDFFDLV